jgi:starch phosphorylase
VRPVERFSVEQAIAPAGPLAPGSMPRVAYFSPEFGVSEEIPQYSGGLGVLAGDYLRVCADEGWPLVGVGLFYRQGYFHQHLDQSGWQQESYRELEPEHFGLVQVSDQLVELELGDRVLRARVWRQQVGKVPLYLLDTVGVGNPDDLAQITDRLYGGDTEHRLRQEILLGMGGVRALQLAQDRPLLFHSNEGHAGFLVLERIRDLVETEGLDFPDCRPRGPPPSSPLTPRFLPGSTTSRESFWPGTSRTGATPSACISTPSWSWATFPGNPRMTLSTWR